MCIKGVILKGFLESAFISNIILAVIILNSIALGLLSLDNSFIPRSFLILFDRICLGFYVFEIGLKIAVYQRDFFKSHWNLFDFVIVGFSVIPFVNETLFSFGGDIIIFRLFRVIKVVRIFSAVPQLKFIIMVILKTAPNVLYIGGLLLLVYYIYAIFGTRVFGAAMPEYFGNLGRSFFTLFQIMTGEGWSESIARPTMRIYPYAWIYFISFIIVVSFVVLNIIIGLIIDNISEIKERKNEPKEKERVQ